MNILELNNVRKVYKTKNVETVALKDVNFSVEKNEFIAIMGESGSGKTTLLNVISTLDKQTNGKVVLNGKDISTLKESEVAKFRREKLGFVFQDFNLLDIFSNKDNIFLPMVLSDYKPKEMEQRLSEIQGLLGIESFVNKYPYEVSGGQRQRIGIARALAVKPEFIVCDEPISALDVSIQAQVVNLLIELQREKKLTYLFISHDLSMVKHISDRIGVMYLGSMVEVSSNTKIYNQPLHPYTKALISAIPIPDPDVSSEGRVKLQGEIPSPINAPEGCKFCTRCNYAMEICKTDRPVLQEIADKHFVACHLFDKGLDEGIRAMKEQDAKLSRAPQSEVQENVEETTAEAEMGKRLDDEAQARNIDSTGMTK